MNSETLSNLAMIIEQSDGSMAVVATLPIPPAFKMIVSMMLTKINPNDFRTAALKLANIIRLMLSHEEIVKALNA